MAIDMSSYKKAPNGVVGVLKPEVANSRLQTKLQNQLLEGRKVYVAQNNEVEELRAAIKAGLPVALVGPPGVGKTTLVGNLGIELKQAIGTAVGTRAKLYEVIGHANEYGDECVYHDGPVSLHARATERSILYLDEAIHFPSDIYTSLSSMLDQRSMLPIKETGEELPTSQLSIILAFNPPTVDYQDLLPTAATLDRLVVIRFAEHTGEDMLRILRVKYGLEKDPETGERYQSSEAIMRALKEYGKKLAKIYDDLNAKTAMDHQSVVVKKVTTRSAENALRLIGAGLPPNVAAENAMVNPMVPLEDELVPKFLSAAKEVVGSWLGRR
jgi:MoxR-like ATPase